MRRHADGAGRKRTPGPGKRTEVEDRSSEEREEALFRDIMVVDDVMSEMERAARGWE